MALGRPDPQGLGRDRAAGAELHIRHLGPEPVDRADRARQAAPGTNRRETGGPWHIVSTHSPMAPTSPKRWRRKVASALAEAVAARGEAAIAVSGSSTPKAFFKALSAKDINWKKVAITLVDERFVPPESDRSNHALVSAMLLQMAAAAKFLPLYHAVADAEDAAFVAAGDAERLPRPFDVGGSSGMGGGPGIQHHLPGRRPSGRGAQPEDAAQPSSP